MIITTNTSNYIERKLNKKTHRIIKKNNETMTSTINNNVVFQDIPENLFEIAKNMSDELFVNTFFKDSILRQEYYRLKQSIENDNKGIKWEILQETNYEYYASVRFVGIVNDEETIKISFDVGTEDIQNKKLFNVILQIRVDDSLDYRFVKYFTNFSYATFQQYKKLIDNGHDMKYLEYLIFGLMTNILGNYIKPPENVCKEVFKTSTIVAIIISILFLIIVVGLIFWRISHNKLKTSELSIEPTEKE